MNRNKIYVILLSGILFSANMSLQARQNQAFELEAPVLPYDEDEIPRYAFSIEPLYMYNGSLRLNVAKRLESGDCIEANITGYCLPHNNTGNYITANSDFEQIIGLGGLGVGSTYKYYILQSLYIGGGASYTYYRVQYRNLDFYGYEAEDGLTFYKYQYQNCSQTYNKFTANLSIGIHSTFHRTFLVEYYFGLGYAHSLYNKNKAAYNSTPFGFGYRGMYPAAGIKIGINVW
ncbi:MAG: hypothetical protein LBE71_00580 [Dysgonamonadaceae bacterium]|jgi:hypothetical protein|nr:hypothetical protein [Dysgonamonadaceae bacterium]